MTRWQTDIVVGGGRGCRRCRVVRFSGFERRILEVSAILTATDVARLRRIQQRRRGRSPRNRGSGGGDDDALDREGFQWKAATLTQRRRPMPP